MLDLFAGTGALGLEALSRGAGFALFVDDGAEARALIRQNVEALGLGRRHAHLPPRRDEARPGASGRAVLAGVPRSALWTRARRAGARSALDGGWLDRRRAGHGRGDRGVFKTPDGFEEIERRQYDDTEFTILRHNRSTYRAERLMPRSIAGRGRRGGRRPYAGRREGGGSYWPWCIDYRDSSYNCGFETFEQCLRNRDPGARTVPRRIPLGPPRPAQSPRRPGSMIFRRPIHPGSCFSLCGIFFARLHPAHRQVRRGDRQRRPGA